MPINLADPDLYVATGALAELQVLQKTQPVYWNALPEGGGFWALTRYADAVQVYRAPKAFTSTLGIQIGQITATRALPAAGKMLVLSDTRAHQRVKAIMSRHLTPTALSRLLPDLQATAGQRAERLAKGEPFDFVAELAEHLTFTALGTLLGVPPRERPQMARWTSAAFAGDDPAANAQLFVYLSDQLSRRRQRPEDDLLSALAGPGDNDGTLNDEEILLNVHLLLAGGHETTRHVLTGTATAFIDHPAQWARLRVNPLLIATAVEEIIRWASPSLNVMRTATQDITIGTTLVQEGERVTIWNPVVNRDDRVFADPDAFDAGRQPNRHLSFGMGSHFCLGAWLARQELQVLIEALMPRVRRLERAGTARRTRSTRTWGYDSLPVRLVA
jgi:cytochrome P450